MRIPLINANFRQSNIRASSCFAVKTAFFCFVYFVCFVVQRFSWLRRRRYRHITGYSSF
jgi:hypothetical protein